MSVDDEASQQSDDSGEWKPAKKKYTTYGPNPKAQEARRKKFYNERDRRLRRMRFRRVQRIVVWGVVLVAVVASAIWIYYLPRRHVTPTAPVFLQGMWVTSDEAYKGRYVVIQEDHVVIGTGGGETSQYSIDRVRVEGTQEGTLYSIESVDSSGGRLEHAFYYSSRGGGSIRFTHRPDVKWVRK